MREADQAQSLKIPILYLIISCILTLVFPLIFREAPSPLPPWALLWWFLKGLIITIDLFPALALSAVALSYSQGLGRLHFDRFSPLFWEKSLSRLIFIFVTAVLYSVFYLLALPSARDSVAEMQIKGKLYYEALVSANEAAEAGLWRESASFTALCEGIWLNSPDTAQLRDKLAVNYLSMSAKARLATKEEASRLDNANSTNTVFEPSLPGVPKPATARSAIQAARERLSAGAQFDAHWLAQVALRLSSPAAPERVEAERIASEAWNAIEALKPTLNEAESYSLYKLKREAYAMASAGDWLDAYYSFLRLASLTDNDPDVERYLSLSQEGVRGLAFFVDEMDIRLGEVDSNVVLSLPMENGNRVIVRAKTLHSFPDYAYAKDLEILSIGIDQRINYHLIADYGKILPNSAMNKNELGTVFLLRAVDRDDENIRWEAKRLDSDEAPSSILNMPVDFNLLLLASRARRGVDNMALTDLITASAELDVFGYATSAFRVELIRRLSEPFIFCITAIWVLSYAWRLRPKRGSILISFLMFFLLPIVLNFLIELFRITSSGFLVYLTISLPYTLTLVAALAFEASLLVAALIFFSGQRA